MKQYIKNTLGILTIALAASAAAADEIEQFISETMAERRAQNAQESVKPEAKSEVQQIVLPESKLSAKTKSLKSRSYKYDKAGRLVSVMCEACPELNESYVYDKQGNILEKRVGDKTYTYKYDTANQLASMESAEGLREYVYDMAGRLIEEKLNGKTDVKYTYGYLDKVTEVNRNGKITKFVYDGTGMLASKISSDGKVENWMWDGLALIRRGKDIHVNEPHISGGVPIVSKTPNGTQFHESDFLGTTLWSIDTKGNVVSFQNDTIFGDGTIKTNRCARFTGKPYDEDLQAFVFPCRNYDEKSARWRSADPAGYPDGLNQHFYAGVPTLGLDILGTDYYYYHDGYYYYSDVDYFASGQAKTQINNLNDALQHYRSGAGGIVPAGKGLISEMKNDSSYASKIQSGLKSSISSKLKKVDYNTSSGEVSSTPNASRGLECNTLGSCGVSIDYSTNWSATEWERDGDGGYYRDVFVSSVTIYMSGSDDWDFSWNKDYGIWKNIQRELIPGAIAGAMGNPKSFKITYSLSEGFKNIKVRQYEK